MPKARIVIAPGKIFDNDFYTQMLGTKIMYNDVFYDILLGANVFMDDDDINPLLYAFSPDGDGYGDVLSFCSQAVRNYILKGFQITDARGNIIASGKADTFNPKSYAVDSHLLTFVDDVWDGRDNNNLRYIYPDGKYYLTVFAVSAYNGSSVQSHTIPFYIDTQKPKITNVSVHGNKLSISASDNLAIQSVGVYNNETYDELVLFGSMTATSNVTVEFDITGVTGFIYIELIDYAMNLYTVRVSV